MFSPCQWVGKGQRLKEKLIKAQRPSGFMTNILQETQRIE